MTELPPPSSPPPSAGIEATSGQTARAAAEWRACIAAFTFLSRLPVSRWAAHGVSDLPAAVAYFPVVGLVIGAFGAACYGASSLLWPAPICVVLSVALTVWLTGAFHEDAAADAFDGFGGGWDREQVLAIMKDSRVGSYALVGVLLLLAAKLAALWAIAMQTGSAAMAGAPAVARALIAAHVLGRWSSAPLMLHHPYARSTSDQTEGRPSAGGPFAAGITRGSAAGATFVAFALAAAVLGWRSVVVIPVAAAVTAAGGAYSARRIGGVTGDVLGAVHQFVEVTTYLVLAVHWPAGSPTSIS